jgi:SHS2 domain-containing protein
VEGTLGSVAYRWIEHTGELELEIEADSEGAVFRDAVAAFAELVGDGGEETLERELELNGGDRAALLAEWIGELVFLAETDDFVPEQVVRLELGPDGLRAALEGRRGAPPHLVKAVTYHRLSFEPSDRGFRARAVLDV